MFKVVEHHLCGNRRYVHTKAPTLLRALLAIDDVESLYNTKYHQTIFYPEEDNFGEITCELVDKSYVSEDDCIKKMLAKIMLYNLIEFREDI